MKNLLLSLVFLVASANLFAAGGSTGFGLENNQFSGREGTNLAPTYSFSSNLSSGRYHLTGPNRMFDVIDGSNILEYSPTALRIHNSFPLRCTVDGGCDLGSPSERFKDYYATGDITIGGDITAATLTVTSAPALFSADRFRASDATNLLPAYSFTGNTDTGFYHTTSRIFGTIDATNVIEIAASGLRIHNSLALVPVADLASPLGSSTERWNGVYTRFNSIAEGANSYSGVATLVAGTVTVSTTVVAANSRIQLTCQDPNGGTPGAPYVSARNVGTDFTITSTSLLDTCIVYWNINVPN